MQDLDIDKITEKVLEQLNDDADLGSKLLFISQIHSSKGSVSVRVSKVAFDMAKEFCDENDMSVNAYVTSALANRLYEDLKNRDKKK